MNKKTINIPEELHLKLKKEAVNKKITLQEHIINKLTEEALQDITKKYEHNK